MHQGEGAGVHDPDSADQVDESTSVGADEEHHLLRVEHDNDWAWRRAIRRRRSTLVAYRAVVLTLGAVLVIGGLMMVPLPGPGWLVVLLGLAVLGSEFEPAQRLLDFAKVRLRAWEDWIRGKPWWVQFFVAALTALFERFGRDSLQAEVRARAIYLVQIGYISMQSREDIATRMKRIPEYIAIYTGEVPQRRELDRFFARHGYKPD